METTAPTTAPDAPLRIEQKRLGTRIAYQFGRDRLEYSWQGSTASRTFAVAYTAISRDRETLSERNPWYRNLGLFWMLLGIALMVADGLQSGGSVGYAGILWLLLGVLSYGYYRRTIAHYIVVPCERGNLMVVDNPDGARIIDEIERCRAAQLRAEYDFFPDGDAPDALRQRFTWLNEEGALTDAEFHDRLNRVDAAALLSGIAQGQRPDRLDPDRDD